MLYFSLFVLVIFICSHLFVHSVPKRFWSAFLSLFYRRIHLRGELPDDDIATLVVANHANAFIDPFAVQVALDRPLIRTVRGDWLNHWLVKWLVRAVGAVPLTRYTGSDSNLNRTSFRLLNDKLSQGNWVIVFPEGVSHNRSRLRPFRKGAAHLAQQYMKATGRPIRILQLGLYYSDKSRLHSEAWVFVASETIYQDLSDMADLPAELQQWQANIQSSLPSTMRRKERQVFNWVNDVLHALNPDHRSFFHDQQLLRSNKQFKQIRTWLQSEGIDASVLLEYPSTLKRLARLGADTIITILGLPITLLGLISHSPAVLLHYWLTRRNSAAEDKWASSAFVIGIPLYPIYWLTLAFIFPTISLMPLVIASGLYALFYVRTWRSRILAMSTMSHCLLEPNIQSSIKIQLNSLFKPLITTA